MKINFDEPPKSAEVNNGIHVNYDNVKRNVPQWRWFLVLALVMLLPAYFVWTIGQAAMGQNTPGAVVLESVLVRAPASGVVEELVAEGTKVTQGQSIAKLRQASSSTEETKSVSDAVLPAGDPYERERKSALQANVKNEQEKVALAQSRVSQMQALFREGAATRQEVDAARMQLLQLQSGLQTAMRDLNLQASVATRQQSSGRSVVATAEVSAPIASQVSKVFALNGQWVGAGDELLIMDSDKTSWVQAYLAPEDLKYAQVGQKAKLLFKSGEKLDAVVQEVSTEAQRMPVTSAQAYQETLGTVLVVKLAPVQELPAGLRVNKLPLEVRFSSHSWF